MNAGAVVTQDNLHTLVCQQAEVPVCPEDGAVLRLEGCGLCGSDIEKLGADRPATPGTVLGHEVIGQLAELGANYHGPFQLGDRVVVAHHVPCLTCAYCLKDSQSMCQQFKATNLRPGGFAEQIALSAMHLTHTTFALPTDLPLEEGICVEPLACVLKAIRRSRPAFSDAAETQSSALVIGLGFIGLLAMQVYKALGWMAYGLERSNARLDWIAAHPDLHVNPASTALTLEALAPTLPITGVDTVFLTVVNSQTLQLGLKAVRDGGTLVMFAAPNNHDPQLDLSPLYFREINLITSYSPSLEDLQEAHRWVLECRIALAPLVTHRVGLQDIDQGVTLARSAKAIKVLVTV